MPPAPPPPPDFALVDPDEERRTYLLGIERFNECDFFAAHEAFEDAWRDAVGIKADFFQGLCQMAVMFEHAVRGNIAGVHKVHASMRRRLEHVPQRFLGLDVAGLLDEVERSIRPLLDHPPVSPYRSALAGEQKPEVRAVWSALQAPRINVTLDPSDPDALA